MTSGSGPSSGATPDRPALRPGDLFAGRYEVGGLVGTGGMGAVYAVLDRTLGERVALKLLTVLGDEDAARFRREVRIARRVTHPNVVRTYDLGEHEGAWFLTMELVDGPSLADRLAARGALPIPEVAALGAQIAAGLGAAHAAGVVHRDLKPGNVLVEATGRVVLTDFGIARFASGEATTAVGTTVGTLGYMAPEQLSGGAVDARTDLYALGLTLFEAAAGRPAFLEPTPLLAALARLEREAPDLREHAEVPAALAELVARCLRRAPAERPASADQVREALGLQAGPPGSAAPRAAVDVSSAPTTPVATLARPPTSERTRPAPRLAVLAFRMRGGCAADQEIGAGLAEELVDDLARCRGLRVLGARVTVRAGDERDPCAAGRELGAELVAEGTLQRSAGHLRVTARLIEVSSGLQLWTERFDQEGGDLLAVEGAIARRIVEALRLELATRSYPIDAAGEAAALFLQARGASTSRRLRGEDGALALLERCLRLAPGFVPAIGAYAIASARAWFVGQVAEGLDGRAAAHAAVERALAEANEVADSHLAAGILAFHEGDHGRALGALRGALERAPTHAEAHEYLGLLLSEAGDVDQGVRHLELAAELDPQRAIWNRVAIARIHALHGRTAEADRLLAEIPRSGSINTLVIAAHELRLGSWAGDLARVARSCELLADAAIPFLRLVVAAGRLRLGALDDGVFEAELELAWGASSNPRYQSLIGQIGAEAFGAAGRPPAALRWLERAAASALLDRDWLDHCPALDVLRPLPGFEAARAKVRARIAPPSR